MCRYVLDSVNKYVFWGAKFDSFGAKKCQPGCKNRLCFVVWECREEDAHALEADFHWLGANTAFTNQRHFHQNTAKFSPEMGAKPCENFVIPE